MVVKNKNDNSAVSNVLKDRLTLPWLIVTIASMVAFVAFLIAMYFEFHAPIFFGILILVIGSMILLDGIHKKRENYVSGNLNFIMVALCVICAVVVMNLDF